MMRLVAFIFGLFVTLIPAPYRRWWPQSESRDRALPLLAHTRGAAAGRDRSSRELAARPAYRALALALSPIGLVAGELGASATRSIRKRVMLSALGVLLLLAPVLVPVSLEYLSGSETYDEYGYQDG